MATPAGRIEKELLLKSIFEEKLPVTYVKDGTEYTFVLERPAGEELVFRSDKLPGGLKAHSKLSLRFEYRERTVHFSAEVLSQQGDLVFCKEPENLYKNQDRAYLRVDVPPDFKISFTFRGGSYNSGFQKVINISASGLLFAFPHGSEIFPVLSADAELAVIIEAPSRTMNLAARIVRRSKDKTAGHIGCRFVNMAPEDMRFLFERLYGKLFDDAAFFTEQV